MTDQPMSRREARELERAQSGAVDLPTPEAPEVVVPAAPMSRREAREAQRSNTEVDFSGLAVEDIQLPATGPIKILEPTAIVVDAVRDITNMSVVLPGSGAVLNTGAIELPWLDKANTGSIAVVEASQDADQALAAEIVENTNTGINPMPARVHERTRRKASVFPNKLRRGWGVVYLVGISAFILGVALCLFIAGVLLGTIKI